MRSLYKIMNAAILAIAINAVSLISITHLSFAQTAGILPPAMSQFFDNNGNPLAAGKVYTYIPSTETNKTTWQDINQTIPNANPIILDSGGKAIIFGSGTYREIVKDSLDNIIWDAVTTIGTTSVSTDTNLVGTILTWAGLTAPSQYAFAYGQEVSRITYPTLLSTVTQTNTVTCVGASATINGLSDTTQIPISSHIESICFAAGTVVNSKTSTSVTLSNNSLISATSTIVFFPWGNGDGSTTFNIPDLRGRAIAGRDNMGGTASARLNTTNYGTDPAATGAGGGNQSKVLAQANLPNITFGNTLTASNTLSFAFGYNGAAYSAGGNAAVASIQDNPSGAGATITTTKTGSITLGGGVQSGGSGTAVSLVQPTMTVNFIIKVTPNS